MSTPEKVVENPAIDQVTPMEGVATTTVEETTSMEQVTVEETTTLEQQPATTSYSVFVPSFENTSNTLISSTFDRYNDSIRNSLEKDLDIIQQKVNLSLQTKNNNFYRNAKW